MIIIMENFVISSVVGSALRRLCITVNTYLFSFPMNVQTFKKSKAQFGYYFHYNQPFYFISSTRGIEPP